MDSSSISQVDSYLPSDIVAAIAAQLWRGDRAPLFDVMALAGVCRAWREVVSFVPHSGDNTSVCLNLNCLESAQPLSKRAAQFRRASLASQRAFLSSAARLLHGPGLSRLSIRGSGGSDILVLQVKRSPGIGLRSSLIQCAFAPGPPASHVFVYIARLTLIKVRHFRSMAPCLKTVCFQVQNTCLVFAAARFSGLSSLLRPP
jgi:hypothetical protein